MKVFVAGATGAIGRPLVRQLVAADHAVVALTRSVEHGRELEGLGVSAVIGDALAPGTLDQLFERHRPEVAVHQLTTFPTGMRPMRSYRQLQQTNRLRSDGIRLVMAAARRHQTRRVVAQSIAFLYEAAPGTRDEADAVIRDGRGMLGGIARGIAEVERSVLDAADVEGIVLRYGLWYGPGTQFGADSLLRRLLRTRLVPALRGSTAHVNLTLIDDAAAAVIAALSGPVGAYNIVDGDPVPVAVLMDLLAEATGAPRPLVSATPVVRVAGAYARQVFLSQSAASNRRALDELGWEPTHASAAQGLRSVFGG